MDRAAQSISATQWLLLTSNLGAELWASGRPVDRNQVMGVLLRHFRLEFLNRIDEIVVFHALSREDLREIVKIQLMRVQARMRDRAIQREVQDPLAVKVISGEIRTGETIRVARGPQRLVFEPVVTAETVSA